MSEQLRPNLPPTLDNQPPSSSSNPPNDTGFPKQPPSSGNGSGIKLPPISFLSNLSSLPPTSGSSMSSVPRLLNHDRTPSFQSANPPSFQSLLNNEDNAPHMTANAQPPAPVLNSLNDKPFNKLKEPLAFNSKPASLTDLMTNDSPTINNNINNNLMMPQVKLKEEITKPDVQEESDEAIIGYYQEKYGFNDFTDEEKHDILQHEKRARAEKAKNPNYKTYLCYSIIKRLNTVPKDKQKEESKPKPKPREIKKFVKRQLTVDNEDVLNYSLKFPRKHLGSILYTPYPTIETHKQLTVFKQNDEIEIDYSRKLPLLPELSEYINSIVTVRIPSLHITDLQNNVNCQNRAIWGTDIYTDDSDILLILKHCGWLPENNEQTTKTTPGNVKNNNNIIQTVTNFQQFINLIGGDIHVDLIILPKLTQYQGVCRNGLNSRDWLTRHDGVSLALYGIRYGERGSSIDSINSIELKKRRLNEITNDTNGNDKFKLSKEAWENAKTEMAELAKSKKIEAK